MTEQEKKAGMGVDIIIPVYNAIDDLRICLDSIYRHTDLRSNRLILINDNSPDERIRPYLDAQAGRGNGQDGAGGHIIVIHNETNKGFSNNVNLGMAQSESNDVILLNSDTIVTERWVEKMLACAYSDAFIGTVTPLSNNASLCSVPDFCEENSLPEGMDVDQMAAVVEGCSLRKYPRITVANGFCMLVKREVIRLVGDFDAETFGRGYGEENDFCNRAEQMGYIHVMCDDTYIYHSGTKSFVSKEKEAYIQEHTRILEQRYPEQMHANAVHCRDNPNGWVGRNIACCMDIWNGRKNILYLLHSDFREGADDNVGGTQLHVKHLMQNLRQSMNVFVAARDKSFLQVTAYCGDSEHRFRFLIGDKPLFPVLHSRELAGLFRRILTGFRIDMVHVHHTASTSLDIFFEADRLGIPVVYTAHDFYFVCPNVKMLDAEGNFCIGNATSDCKECLRRKAGLYERNDYLAMWRGEHGRALDICSRIIVPSESAGDILADFYPDKKDRIQVIGHGMDQPSPLTVDESRVVYTKELIWKLEKIDKKSLCPFIAGVAYLKEEPDAQHKIVLKVEDSAGKIIYLPTNFGRNLELLESENRFYAYLPNNGLRDGAIRVSAILQKDGVSYMNRGRGELIKNMTFSRKSSFHVGFIGGINEEKGGRIIADIIKKGPDSVEWYVMGGVGEENLLRLQKANLVKTGFYYQEDLATHLKLHEIDAVCILSKWPETFSYTLSEAILNGLPVIVTDIGALGERVRKNGYGVCVSAEEAAAATEAVQVISEWQSKGERYHGFRDHCLQARHDSVGQMISRYEQLYLQIGEKAPGGRADAAETMEPLLSAMAGCGEEDSTLHMAQELEKLQGFRKMMENSVTFKIVLKITSIKIPFKKQIREWVLRKR